MNQRLALCATMVIALHGAVLAWASVPLDAQSQMQARQGRVVQVRLLSAPQVPAAPEPNVVTARPPVKLEASTGGAEGTATQDGNSTIDLNGYVPRRWLTVAPQPTAPVLLPFPDAFQDRARYRVVLNLYIEADGRVGRVEFEGIALPDLLQHAARSTFEHAQFSPGEVRGRIVKSLIRVEVEFDSLGSS